VEGPDLEKAEGAQHTLFYLSPTPSNPRYSFRYRGTEGADTWLRIIVAMCTLARRRPRRVTDGTWEP
jgi:hypothetical protein